MTQLIPVQAVTKFLLKLGARSIASLLANPSFVRYSATLAGSQSLWGGKKNWPLTDVLFFFFFKQLLDSLLSLFGNNLLHYFLMRLD